MKILKFGGSSVGSPESINNTIKILSSCKKNEVIAVVFSAFGGATNQLIMLGKLSSGGDDNYMKLLQTFEDRHILAVKTLISIKRQSAILANVKVSLNELGDLLKGIFLIRELSPKTLDLLMSFGERLSTYIISEAMKEAGLDNEYLDARKLIITDNQFGSSRVDIESTYNNIKKHFKAFSPLKVIPGFIASAKNNETTTLGRGGSDYTASLIGAALNVSEIEIWTDVNGIMTADPGKVKRAFSIDSLTYEEAMEMSHFGAKVIYLPTMQPAMKAKIPIRVKNTFNPKFNGTLITHEVRNDSYLIKGISSIQDIALIKIQGSGIMGVVGVSMRIFGALARKQVNVILISQASSEYSLCFAVEPVFAETAKSELEQEFSRELSLKLIDDIEVELNLSIVAIVGSNMKKTFGIAGRMFSALGKNGINIVAIAQGSSERNISAVVQQQDEAKALNALHEAFFLSDKKTIHLFVMGTGVVGGTLLQIIQSHAALLARDNHIEVNVMGIANSKKMCFNKMSIPLDEWKNQLQDSNEASDIKGFVQKMKSFNLSNSIFVDCTANDDVIALYLGILQAGISIVAPNKRANSSTYEMYRSLKETASRSGTRFLYETNVGAGLPVINTLNDLLYSGDKIIKIEAVLSGTISFIFNSFTEGKRMSDIVKEARERGYTEPDPRDDLNGMDVARKLLILAREAGMPLEIHDIKLEGLVSEKCIKAASIDAFFEQLTAEDALFEDKRKQAEKKGKKLCYMGTLENGKASIGLREVGNDNPFYTLSGADNMISFTTDRYKERPLVIKGPGAGGDVTAAGVFADIIRVINR